MSMRNILLPAALLLAMVFLGKLAAGIPLAPVAIVLAATVGLITFLKPENGLLVLVFSMLLSPEITLARVPGREVVVRIDDLLLAALFVAWLAHIAVRKDWKGFVKTPLDLPLIVMALVYVASTSLGILSGDLVAVKSLFYVLKYIEYFLLYWATVNIVSSRKDVPKFLAAGLITCVIVAVYAYTLIGKVERVYGPFDSVAQGVTGESASLAGYFIIVMAVVLSFFALEKKARWVLVAFVVFLVPPFIKTLSRASFYGLGAMLVALVLVTPKRRMPLLLLTVAGAILLPLVAQEYYQSLIARLQETFAGPARYKLGMIDINLELSAAARINSWKMAFTEWLARKPLLGHGITGVGLVDAQYPLVLGETGLLGLGAFAFVIGKIGAVCFRMLRSAAPSLDRALSMGLLVALAGLLVQAIAVNTFIIVRIMEPFWFLCGLVMALYSMEPEPEAAESKEAG